MARPPRQDYRSLVSWTDGTHVTVASRDFAAEYQSEYVASQTYRSLLFDQDWLEKACEQCTQKIWAIQKIIPNALSPAPKDVQLQRVLDDTKFVRNVLFGLLSLPIHPFPSFPDDILLEIMQSTAIFHQEPLVLTLISSRVQQCVDPIVFSSCIISTHSRVTDELLGNSEDDGSLLSSYKTPPRVQRCRRYVTNITLETNVTLKKLVYFFPNIRRLIITRYYSSPVIPISIPTLTLLDSRAWIFSDMNSIGDFSNPLFVGLNTLSLNISHCPWTEWDWSTLGQITKLTSLWISVSLQDLSAERQLLETFKKKILPSLPLHTRLCVLWVEAEVWELANNNYFDPLDSEDIRAFAAGRWNSFTVLILSGLPPLSSIPQFVTLDAKGKDFWVSKYQDQVQAVVRAREGTKMC
ncbi:hypothetical protein DL96DRAFT_1688957 [Flagelloscypha sp. PMI_526]|nr:hypothetical protein DL96DRAFT_1688957 [Flagelloscypha sp. PMI_526]